MSYSWDFDATTGVFKNRELSSDMYENALQNSVAMPYVEVQDGFGKGMGESQSFMRFTHIAEPSSAELQELTPIPEMAFSMATSSFVIKEYGVAVPYTGKLEALAKFNTQNVVQRTLMEQMRLVIDTLALNSFKLTNIKYVPTGDATKSVTYNGTASGTAQEALKYWHLEDCGALMYDVLNIPYLDGDCYRGIFRAKTLMTLRRDTAFQAWNQYTNPGAKAKGEVGQIERFRLSETNHALPLPYTSTNAFGSGVVFGQDSVGMIEAETPHLRAALPGNFGRFKAIAWYGLMGFNIILGGTANGVSTQADSIGVTRVIHFTGA